MLVVAVVANIFKVVLLPHLVLEARVVEVVVEIVDHKMALQELRILVAVAEVLLPMLVMDLMVVMEDREL